MARPTKKGLDYFPFDVGFFGDKNIRILKARYQAEGIAVYVKLLCDIYKEGYYLSVECWDDYVYVIADEVGTTIDKVEQILTFLHSRAMARIYRKNELTGYDLDAVITSHGIQKRYAVAVKSLRRKGDNATQRRFWLLTDEEEKEIDTFDKCDQNDSYCGENPSYCGENPSYCGENPVKEKKRNKNKVNKEKGTTVVVPKKKSDNDDISSLPVNSSFDRQAYDEFVARFEIKVDNYDGVKITDMDFTELYKAYESSKNFLQNYEQYPFCRFISWICKNYQPIVMGKYRDGERPREKPPDGQEEKFDLRKMGLGGQIQWID